MSTVIINPGTGPVVDATEESATNNMRHFVADHQRDGLMFFRAPELDYGEGRYAFLLCRDGHYRVIQMPGLPIDRVRYMDQPGQNIWDFPRLYVDGSSWIWLFAIRSDDSHWAEVLQSTNLGDQQPSGKVWRKGDGHPVAT